MTIQDIMHHCRNYFPDTTHRIEGDFEIKHGTLQVSGLDAYSHFLIEGSRKNDGVYEVGTTSLTDETFTGAVTPLCPPPDFLQLCRDIQSWQTTYQNAMHSPFISESFDGYSYTKAGVGSAVSVDWRTIWKAELSRYRKI